MYHRFREHSLSALDRHSSCEDPLLVGCAVVASARIFTVGVPLLPSVATRGTLSVPVDAARFFGESFLVAGAASGMSEEITQYYAAAAME